MSIAAAVNRAIDRAPTGANIRLRDLPAIPGIARAVVWAVNRSVENQRLKRVAKGRFCKPRKDALGDVPIGDDERTLRDVLHRNGRRVGYINGPAPYNRVGRTTQVFADNKFDAVLHIEKNAVDDVYFDDANLTVAGHDASVTVGKHGDGTRVTTVTAFDCRHLYEVALDTKVEGAEREAFIQMATRMIEGNSPTVIDEHYAEYETPHGASITL